MFTFLAFIFLVLIVALVVGLIRPFRYIPMSKTKPTRKKLGLTFGGLILVCFILLGITTPTVKVADTSIKVTPTQPTTKAIAVTATPTSKPKLQYRIAYNDDNGTVQNIFVETDQSNDSQNTVKSISSEIEKTVCKKQCNIDIFDDASALQLQYDYLQESVNYTPQQDNAWAKDNYVFVADHYIGNHEFETSGDFTYYPLKNDSEYQKYKTQ